MREGDNERARQCRGFESGLPLKQRCLDLVTAFVAAHFAR